MEETGCTVDGRDCMHIIDGVAHSNEEVENCVPLCFTGQDDPFPDDFLHFKISEEDVSSVSEDGHRCIYTHKLGTVRLYDVLYNRETGLCALVEDDIRFRGENWEIIGDPSSELPVDLRGMWGIEHYETWYNSPKEMAKHYKDYDFDDTSWLKDLIGRLPCGTGDDDTVFVRDGTPQADFAVQCLCG